jgi:16S rRNA (cytosine967-C5)-methyltransferase
MSISIARKIAFDVLLRVAVHGAYSDEALRAAFAKSLNGNLKSDDAGLATDLTFGVLRWQRLLDFRIDRYITSANKSLDPEVRIALRLGIYQLFFLQRVPAHAAVNESVELVKLARKRSAAPLVNAVLRKAAKEPPASAPLGEAAVALLSGKFSLADRMGIQHSHPTWLVERWLTAFGENRTQTLLAANNRVPSLSGYIAAAQHREDILSSLQKTGCTVKPGRLLRSALLLEGGNPSEGEIVRRGWLAIQDEASQSVTHLLAVESGDTVLDLCAAPGGKSLRLALDAGPAGKVLAADLHPHRVRAMAERFKRAEVLNIETQVLDASVPLPFSQKFDRILVDVPCSGTGTLARNPEIRWRLRPEDFQDLHVRQTQLLRNALPHLAPGGRLVYSTCSLEPEENEDVIGEVLATAGNTFRIVSARSAIESFLQETVPVESIVHPDGFFRTIPGEQETDGFFGAVMLRVSDAP